MPASHHLAEEHKALVRRMILDFDSQPVEATYKWMTPDFVTLMNGEPPMGLEAYRQLAGTIAQSFSNLRHEIIDMVAEDDRVAVVMTLHLTHTGEYEGIAATGRTIRVAEMAVLQIREGKIAAERVVVDFASMHQQMTAP